MLNAELLTHESATATLEQWCGTHHLADTATIVAERVVEDKPPTAEQRHELRVDEAEVIRYRRVKLRCGSLVLSEADNWYVPSRLTAEMNRLLDTTDAPFGRVVKSLDFRRHTISASVLSPFLPPGWETMPRARIEGLGEPCVPAHLLEHRAILTLPDGTPFSEVIETYTGGALAIPQIGLRPCAV
jgi:chorismate-pyruvate lyase